MKKVKLFLLKKGREKYKVEGTHTFGKDFLFQIYSKKRFMFFSWYIKRLTFRVKFSDSHSTHNILMPLGINPVAGYVSYQDNEENLSSNYKKYILKSLNYICDLKHELSPSKFPDLGGQTFKVSGDINYTYNPKYEHRNARLEKILEKNKNYDREI